MVYNSKAQEFLDKGKAFLEKVDLIAAYHSFLAANRIDPSSHIVWTSLGDALSANKQFEMALACQRHALALDKSAYSYLRVANAQSQLRRFEEAKENFWISLKLNPTLSKSYYGLAFVAMQDGDGLNARKYIDEALKLEPDVPDIHYTSALIGLMFADWERGFSLHYESRFKLRTTGLPNESIPWTGQDLTGKTLSVYCEQGFGDCFMFLRYLKLLPKCNQVTLVVPKNIRRLLDYNYENDYDMYNAGTHEPRTDYSVSAASIPYYAVLSKGKKFEPDGTPYLAAPDVFFKRTPNTKKAVGMVWDGDDRHPNHKLRYVDPIVMASALMRPGIDLCSLQVGDNKPSALCGELGILRDLGKSFSDFYDTACIIKQLDCVVSIDTGVANLCGAMGKECHVLSAYGGTDWRWMKNCDYSPWYPTVRIHRQRKGEQWSDVLERVAECLETSL